MLNETDFAYSQSNLQDYLECRRRFQLRYMERRQWPALDSEPVLENERLMRQGQRFHLMVQQYLCGVPAERLSAQAGDGELGQWWLSYLNHTPGLLEQAISSQPEVTLVSELNGYRLLAKLDLVQRLPGGRMRIIDWKTARRRPKRTWLLERMQTRLYPFLLTRAGQQFNDGKPVDPDAVEMCYWFTSAPEQIETVPYSVQAYRRDQAELSVLLDTIQHLGPGNFSMTSDERRCVYCVYRSLCERGLAAGHADDVYDEADPDWTGGLDFDQIAEISF